MSSLERTLKIPAFGNGEKEAAASAQPPEQETAQQLARLSAQLEAERKKAQDQALIMQQLQSSLEKERANSAQLAQRLKELEEAQKNVVSPARFAELQEQLVDQKMRAMELAEVLDRIAVAVATIKK